MKDIQTGSRVVKYKNNKYTESLLSNSFPYGISTKRKPLFIVSWYPFQKMFKLECISILSLYILSYFILLQGPYPVSVTVCYLGATRYRLHVMPEIEPCSVFITYQ